MSEALTTVSVRILDKEYQVSCRQDEVDALSAAARYVDGQMREIREAGKVFGLDRIAVMTALNLSNELLLNRNAVASRQNEADSMVSSLTDRITRALGEHKQLDL